MKKNPWHKARFSLPFAGKTLNIDVPHDVFSTFRIDEGTILLLENLPSGQPQKILDMGCGYGALGLPVAVLHSKAVVEMVDRDLLAVEWARRNALENGITNAVLRGSLGFDRIEESDFDWILCNVPARIGKPFISHLFSEGWRRLGKSGEIRVVVIRDLIPVLQEIGRESGFNALEVAAGPRHSVFSLSRAGWSGFPEAGVSSDLYLRDIVEFSGHGFERPFDLGGDDPKRLRGSLPLLLDTLPRQNVPGQVLCIRTGYGVLPYLCRDRWSESQITAYDRDLLAIEFTRRNFERVGGCRGLEIKEGWFFPEVISPQARFDLITLEISASAGALVAREELLAIESRLNRGGVALTVCFDKIWKEWIQPLVRQEGLSVRAIAARDGFTVFSLECRD